MSKKSLSLGAVCLVLIGFLLGQLVPNVIGNIAVQPPAEKPFSVTGILLRVHSSGFRVGNQLTSVTDFEIELKPGTSMTGYRYTYPYTRDGITTKIPVYAATEVWVGDLPAPGALVQVSSPTGRVRDVVITDLKTGREYRTAIKGVKTLPVSYYLIKSFDNSGNQLCREYAAGVSFSLAIETLPEKCRASGVTIYRDTIVTFD